MQNALMAWSTKAENVTMLLDPPGHSPLMNKINDHLALNLVDICLNITLPMLCKSLLCFAKIWKIEYSKIGIISLAKF